MDGKPDTRGARLFTADMIKMIIGQSIYQIAIIIVFHFHGETILGSDDHSSDMVVQTLVFNAFVFAQIFNSINCRRLDNKLNIFEGTTKNKYFVVITFIGTFPVSALQRVLMHTNCFIEIVGQVLIVFIGGDAFQVTRIPGREWGISPALGVVTLPLGVLIRCISTPPPERALIKIRLMSPDHLPTTKPEVIDWNPAIVRVRDNLSLFFRLRGGRVRAFPFVLKSKEARIPYDRGSYPRGIFGQCWMDTVTAWSL